MTSVPTPGKDSRKQPPSKATKGPIPEEGSPKPSPSEATKVPIPEEDSPKQAPVEITFSPESWFKTLFGFSESVREVYSKLKVKELSDHAELTSTVNKRSFNAGQFRIRNISSFTNLPPVGGGKVNIIRGGGGSSSRAYLIDVLLAQSYIEFDGATFLAASNFNCLEFMGPSQTASSGVTCYVYDHTQGPFCALAAGPAAVYRNYFIKHANGKQGQIAEEINLLQDTPLASCVSHGYPIISREVLRRVLKHDWYNLDQFYVGVHENCEVTTTRAKNYKFKSAPPGRIVHHVYAAAFNFCGTVIKCRESINIGKKMLMAEYKATVLAAWELSQKYRERKGSNKLILTFLGGGVFGNPREMICEAICSCQEVIVQSGLEVYIVCWNNYEFEESFPELENLMTETGGKVIDAK